jgi:group I intron endonuclease
MAVIYRITNMLTGDYYIGSAESFERRKWQHTYALKRNEHKNPRMQAAWNKYGAEAFVFEILEAVPEHVLAFEIENTYLRKCVGQPDCYNVNVDAFVPRLGIPHRVESKEKISTAVQKALSEGRGGKFIPSDETKAKMSSSAMGNKNALGYKRTPEEVAAIRQRTLGNQNFLGKRHTEESRAKMGSAVVAHLPDGTTREYVTMSLMAEQVGVFLPTIIRACKSGNTIKMGKLSGWRIMYKGTDFAPLAPAPEIPPEYAHLPRTRQLAKEQGAPMYFTGVPCGHGHIAPRKTKGQCVECAKIEGQKSNERARIKKLAAATPA